MKYKGKWFSIIMAVHVRQKTMNNRADTEAALHSYNVYVKSESDALLYADRLKPNAVKKWEFGAARVDRVMTIEVAPPQYAQQHYQYIEHIESVVDNFLKLNFSILKKNPSWSVAVKKHDELIQSQPGKAKALIISNIDSFLQTYSESWNDLRIQIEGYTMTQKEILLHETLHDCFLRTRSQSAATEQVVYRI